MKTTLQTLFGALLGLFAAGIIFLVSAPPRGEAVALLPPPTLSPLFVDVSGAVLHPGVYSVSRNARVQDAINAAGGLSRNADAEKINLAAGLEDGQKIVVPEKISQPVNNNSSASGNSSQPVTGTLININTADLALLDTLPGIGPSTAQKIIDYRNQHGAFQTIEEIMNVPNIGPATFEKIKDLITVE
jgi:competence protein ComEA